MTINILTGSLLTALAIAMLIVTGYNYPSMIRSFSVNIQLRCRRCALGILGCFFGYLATGPILPFATAPPSGFLEQCLWFLGIPAGIGMAAFTSYEATKMRHIVLLCSGYSEVSFRRNSHFWLEKLLGPCEVILLESKKSMHQSHSEPLWLQLLMGIVGSSDRHSGGSHFYSPKHREWNNVVKEMMSMADLIVFSSDDEFDGVRTERDIVIADAELFSKAAIMDCCTGSNVAILRGLSLSEAWPQLPMFSRSETIGYAAVWLAGVLACSVSLRIFIH
jgi:hypothetical protein